MKCFNISSGDFFLVTAEIFLAMSSYSGDKVREARRRFCGHVQRREGEYICRRMLKMEQPGWGAGGRIKRGAFMDVRERTCR